jgi:Tfp pilus assembly protein PilW
VLLRAMSRGFSLIEILLYAGLAAVILGAVSGMHVLYQQTRIKSGVIAEVEQQGTQVLQLVTQAVRNAEEITSPSPGGSSASTLALDMYDGSVDPTTFDSDSGVIRVCEGSGCSVVDITNDLVAASDIAFQNLSRTDTPGVVKIEFTLAHTNPEDHNEYDYTKTFYATAALR